MNLRKSISAALAAVMTLTVTPTPVLAAEDDSLNSAVQSGNTDLRTDVSEMLEPQAAESNKSGITTVTDSVPVVYMIIVPESVAMTAGSSGSGTKSATVTIRISGDIPEDQAVSVTSSTPVMTHVGSKDVTAQVKKPSSTAWTRTDCLNGGTYRDYIVSADLTPGDWNGTITFNCDLTNATSSDASDESRNGIIPVGAIYNRDGAETVGDGVAIFPDSPQSGDIYVEGDYAYLYGLGEVEDGMDFGSDWEAITLATLNFWGSDTINEMIGNDILEKYADGVEENVAYASPVVSIAGEPVTRLGCTYESLTLMEVAPVIPSSIISMESAFCGCASLEVAPLIPSKVINMYGSFSDCTSLVESPVIPNGVMDISSTFDDCTSLTAAPVILGSVTDMYKTFYGCTALEEAPDIPNSVTDITGTFRRCTSLTQAPLIPNSVTDMSYTFSGCTSLADTMTCNAKPIYLFWRIKKY